MTILFNNKFIDQKDAKISIFSNSFMYGLGAFETLRTYRNKKIFKSKEHIDRLLFSAKKINLKVNYKKSEIQKMLIKITEKSPYKLQRIKIIAIEEGIIIISIKLTENPSLLKGVNCKTVKMKRSLPEVKSLSYLDSYLAHKIAENNNYYESILLDENDEVYEGSYSNIFWFEGETLCTRKNNVLSGITASTVIENSPYKVKYKKIKIQDLIKKEEVFLTQTTKGILPIIKINNKTINNGKVGKKTKNLIQIFQNQII